MSEDKTAKNIVDLLLYRYEKKKGEGSRAYKDTVPEPAPPNIQYELSFELVKQFSSGYFRIQGCFTGTSNKPAVISETLDALATRQVLQYASLLESPLRESVRQTVLTDNGTVLPSKPPAVPFAMPSTVIRDLIRDLVRLLCDAAPHTDAAALTAKIAAELNDRSCLVIDPRELLPPEIKSSASAKDTSEKDLQEQARMNRATYYAEEAALMKEHAKEYVAYRMGKRLALGPDKDAVYAEARKCIPNGPIFVQQIGPQEVRRLRNPWTGSGRVRIPPRR
ncbi:MAG TPA: hypothetical protein VMZ06_17370 [Candidatus Bathyarchaeia archaeon]|nr:hypothetical protein [Candidatus Bathyarchaeia archaeon]